MTKRSGAVKRSVLKHLLHVDYYEDGRSVGLSYKRVLELVKTDVPWSNCTVRDLHKYAAQIRVGDGGFGAHTLPGRRPRPERKKY